jgi:NADH-quinone oxidoreductase subunit H
VQAIGIFIAASVGTLVAGLASSWIDRKVTARVQYRVGPPLLQPVYDILKLMGKETLVSSRSRGRGFLLAPVVGLAAGLVAVSILWAANLWPAEGFLGDLIVVIYLLTVPAIAAIYGALASGSPHATFGASREMKLLLSYELPLVLAVLVPVVQRVAAGGEASFSIGALVAFQAESGWVLFSLSGILAAAVALVAMQAKLTLVPFDLPEAETELMAGSMLEYSGPPLAMIKLTRALLLAAAPVFLVTLFAGGVSDAGSPLAWLAFAGKYVVVLVLVVLMRNTNPRLRIDQVVRLFWFGLAPVAALALVLAWFGL